MKIRSAQNVRKVLISRNNSGPLRGAFQANFPWAEQMQKHRKLCLFSLVGPLALVTQFGALAGPSLVPAWAQLGPQLGPWLGTQLGPGLGPRLRPKLGPGLGPDAAGAAAAGRILRSQPDPSPNAPRDQIRRKDPCCDAGIAALLSPLRKHQKQLFEQ